MASAARLEKSGRASLGLGGGCEVGVHDKVWRCQFRLSNRIETMTYRLEDVGSNVRFGESQSFGVDV